MKILLLETLTDSATELLRQHVEVTLAAAPDDYADALANGPYDAVITRGKGRVTPELLDQLTADGNQLKAVARCGVGLDNVDIEACTERGIPVLNLPGATTIAVGEQCAFLMLAAVRQLIPTINQVSAGDWSIRDQYSGNDVNGRTLGLIGFGDIAQRFAAIAQSLGMKIQYWNHRPKDSLDVLAAQVELDDLLRSSDIISLHIPLNSDTTHFVSSKELAKMKPTAVLINTARGAVVNHADLLQALESNQLAAYAADVHDPEPPADGTLIEHPRTIFTPHISALTGDTYSRMAQRTAENVLALLQNRPPEANCIFNRESLDE